VRQQAWPVVERMIGTYWPIGSGVGSFEQAYKIDEPDASLSPLYLNHAHNDWLEVPLTTGLPGVLLLISAVAAWLIGTIRAIRRAAQGAGRRVRLGLAGSAVIALTGLASVVDYPVRTPSIAVLVVLAAMWLSTAKSAPTQI